MRAMETVGQIGPIEVPTPAHAVRLRRPVCLIATYVVACTALLVSVSLLPFGSGATAPVANARGDRERAGPVVERRDFASPPRDDDAREGNRRALPSRDSEPAAGETRRSDDDDDDDDDDDELAREHASDDKTQEQQTPLEDRCVFHVYRHLSKTGGTTARFVFDRQTVFGDFEYPLEYGFDEKKWDDLLVRWRKKADAFLDDKNENENAFSASPPRTLVEIRGNWPSNWPAEAFEGRILTDVETLRLKYGANSSSSAADDDALASPEDPIRKKSCSVTTSLMLRDPFKQYESFWRYYIEKRQTEVTDGTTRDENLALKKWPDVHGAAFWGASFAEWASRVPSMQIREALGNKCVAQMRQPGFDAEFRDGTWVRTGNHSFDGATCDHEVTELDFRRFEKLLRRIDVVGVTERFDAFLLRLAEVVGLRRLEYVKSNASRKNADENGGLSVDESSGSPRNEKRDASETETERIARAVVSEVAEWDIQAHVLAKRTQEEEIKRNAIGGTDGFEERLRAFVSKTAVLGGTTFVGGVPKRSPYVWVKAEEVKASGGALKPVVPKSFTDETGGGQAVAYIVFDPVTLVRRDDAEQSGAACVKGCTFDAPT